MPEDERSQDGALGRKNSDQQVELTSELSAIADELYSRKLSLRAAAAQLTGNGTASDSKPFSAFGCTAFDRMCEQLDSEQRWALAVTDSFVEKAQLRLTLRANRYYCAGICCLALAVIIGFCFYTGAKAELTRYSITQLNMMHVQTALVVVFARLVMGSIFVAGLVLSVSFARSFLHEASTLLAKRHALRFGRLAVYLKKGRLEMEELEDAFAWNLTSESAFMANESEKKVSSALATLADTVVKLSESVATVTKAGKPEGK